jgi:outer membrane protein OmpA-like peptidoglycan-associated protein
MSTSFRYSSRKSATTWTGRFGQKVERAIALATEADSRAVVVAAYGRPGRPRVLREGDPMRRLVSAICACIIVFTVRELEADACGVKLSVRPPRIRPRAPCTDADYILLLGGAPGRLSKELTSRGFAVQVASSPAAAHRARYCAIVADRASVDDAKARWPRAPIIVRKGDSGADADQVERQLGTKPFRRVAARVPKRTSSEERAPIRRGPPPREYHGSLLAAGGGTGGEASIDAPASETFRMNVTSELITRSGSGKSDDPARRPAEPVVRSMEAGTSIASRSQSQSTADDDERTAPAPFTRRIFFKNASSDLSGRARAQLIRSARWLKKQGTHRITVEGHASAVGPAESNQALSEMRAQVVKEFLVEQGIEASRIQIAAFGLSSPEYEPGGNGKNRRVVIRLAQ